MDQAEARRWTRAAELLDQVLDLPGEQQLRAAAELGAANDVQSELESLLAGARGSSVLDASLAEALQQMPPSAPEPNALKGQVIGQWLLGEEIGRGGMSIVYHASRTGQDFEQHAALKILWVDHLGEDFVASFLRERQILSDLQHPGIGRLIDGGITATGAPFLVMQHVEGERIDRWCQEQAADLRTVVRLVVRLCQAVDYAQRRLVVHQDIKPANVLVDEHRQPILIDFGIARLLDQASGERAPRVFTPQYAAPEQRAGGAITTATDVFALGTLLRRLLRGYRLDRDLEAILQAATQEDPERRYANARNLAADLQAWLEVRPVRARPQTFAYLAGRFVARNRWGVAAAVLVLVSMLGGLGAALWQARVAAAERDLAQAESARALQVTRFLKDLFRASDPDEAQGEDVSARSLLDQGAHQVRNAFEDAPDLRTDMLILLGDLYRELGELEEAEALLSEALEAAERLADDALRVEALRGLALTRMEVGSHEEALALLEQAEGLLLQAAEVPGPRHAALMEPMLFSMAEMGRAAEAAERGEAALAAARSHADLPESALYEYLYSVANVLLIAERIDDAEALLREAAAIEFRAVQDPTTRIALHSNLAGVLVRRSDLDGAVAHRREAVALAERIYPPDHLERARKLSNLGGDLSALGRPAEAEEALRTALEIYEQVYGGTAHPRVAAAHNNLGRALQVSGRYAAAEPHLVKARDLAQELFGAEDPRFVTATSNLGDLYRRLGDLDRADELLEQSLELRRSVLGSDHRATGIGMSLLVALRIDQGRFAEALELSDEALALGRRIELEDPRYYIVTLGRRAQALAGLERLAESEADFREALQLGEDAGADAGTTWPELLAAYAEFLVQKQDPAAGPALERALAAHRQTLGPEHPDSRRLLELAAANSVVASE